MLEGSRDAGIRDTGLIQFEYRKEAREGEAVEGLYDTLAAHIYTLVEQKRQHRQFLDCLSLADLSAGKVSKRGNHTSCITSKCRGLSFSS